MYICICSGTTELQIQNSIKLLYAHHNEIDLELLKEITNSGKKCGSCLNEIKKLMETFPSQKQDHCSLK